MAKTHRTHEEASRDMFRNDPEPSRGQSIWILTSCKVPIIHSPVTPSASASGRRSKVFSSGDSKWRCTVIA